MGNLLGLNIHEANIQDRAGGVPLVKSMMEERPTVGHLWGDSGYTGTFARDVRRMGITVEIVTRADLAASNGIWHDPQLPLPTITRPRFVLMKRRWVVERTFAWLGRYRRLAKDYEEHPDVSEAVVWVAACRMMCQRLAYA